MSAITVVDEVPIVRGADARADGDYRAALVASLPRLKKLDGVDVTGRERDDAMAAFGEDEDEGEREGEGRTGNRGDRTGRRAAELGESGVRRRKPSVPPRGTSRQPRRRPSATPLDLARYEPCSRCSRTPRCSSTRWEPR